jgi:GNAT superfamily N-acetyltransferase
MADLAQVVFRPAKPDDAGAVASLHADSWRRHYRGAYSDVFLDGDVWEDRLHVWTERFAADIASTATILAEDDGVLVGFVHVVFDEDPEWGSLVDNLHVVYGRKRAGIGTRLMAKAARSVIERGPGGLYLWALGQNLDAQAFYAALSGRRAEPALAGPPGGDPSRLIGQPAKLRYVWGDVSVLVGRELS